MVTRLPEPDVDVEAYLHSVVQERQNGKHAQFFSGMGAEWQKRALFYRANLGNPEVIVPWEEVAQKKKTLQNLYLSPADHSIQSGVLATLRARTLQLCPACGEEGTPNTLDHYLPKESYPEFAILPHNLLPMCDACQSHKGSQTVDAANRRLFIHAYYDAFVSEQIVLLIVGEPFNAPASIALEPSAHLTRSERNLVRRHLSGLEIMSRYYRFFRTEYLHLLRIVNLLRATDQNVERALSNFRDLERMRCINGWKHIFYSGVLENQNLVSYLAQEQLPKV